MEYKKVPASFNKMQVIQLKVATEDNTISAEAIADFEDLDIQERDWTAEEESIIVGIEIEHFPDEGPWGLLGFVSFTDNQAEDRRDGALGLMPPFNQVHILEGALSDNIPWESLYKEHFWDGGYGIVVEELHSIYLVGTAHNIDALAAKHYACIAYVYIVQKG